MRRFAKVKAIIHDNDDQLVLWVIALAIMTGAFIALAI